MSWIMLAGVWAAVAVAPQSDTTFAVAANARLDVSNYGGTITVNVWDQNQVAVRAEHSGRDAIVVEQDGNTIKVHPRGWEGWESGFRFEWDWSMEDDPGERIEQAVRRRRPAGIVDIEITVPAGMAMKLGGPRTHVIVEGTRGEVEITVGEGDVELRGGSGVVTVRSMEGDVYLSDADGTTRVVAVDGDVEVKGVTGSLEVETTDGSITMSEIGSNSVTASSVDGDIEFEGTVQAQGLYVLNTHDGDVMVMLPSDVSARISVATFDGDFETDFDVTAPDELRGRRFSFTLGGGAAQIEIEAFDGDIEVLRRQ